MNCDTTNLYFVLIVQFLLDGLTAPSLFIIYYITTRVAVAYFVLSFIRLENIYRSG